MLQKVKRRYHHPSQTRNRIQKDSEGTKCSKSQAWFANSELKEQWLHLDGAAINGCNQISERAGSEKPCKRPAARIGGNRL